MLSKFKRNIKILQIYLKYNIVKEMENRGSFISQMLFMILNDASFLIQWFIFFSFKDTIGGYDFKDILMLWALIAAIYGVSHIFFENVYCIPELISNGKLDVYITQPLNILWNISISKTNPSAFGDLIYGIILSIISSGLNFYKIISFILFSILGGITLTAFSALMGSLTFWLKRGDQLGNSLNFAILVSGVYPEGIFKNITKLLFYTIIPTGFIVYTPLRIISKFNLVSFMVVFFSMLLFVLVAFYVFHKGLKKYSSSNLMNTRV